MRARRARTNIESVRGDKFLLFVASMLDPFALNLRHLRALPLIRRHGRMGGAAQAANLSQPALTQGLAKLEAQLGARLFDRTPDGMVATAAGAAFIERIERALALLAAATRRSGRATRGFARPDQLMTATQLRAFLALADTGSFVEAAEATGWSQPALHRAVRDLEQIAAVPLVERRGRGVALSDDGRRLARGIRLAAAEIVAGVLETRPDASLSGRLVIGAMPLSRARVLPRTLARLLRAAPSATVDVVEGSWRELIEPLRDGAIDLTIGALRPEAPPGTVQTALFVDRLAVVARAGHPLAAEPDPDLATLARYPWIVGSARSPLRLHWEALFGDEAPAAPVECGSVMTIRGLLLDSDCLTLLSPDQIAMEVEAGLLATIGAPRAGMVRTIGVTTRAHWRPAALGQLFLDLLAQETSRN